jgi:signal transduction histidine kinase
MPSLLRHQPSHQGTPLPWWLAGLAVAALMFISVAAWRGADAQQQAAEAAVVKFATVLADAQAREFSQAVAQELANSLKIKLQWFSVPGEPEDWIFGPWPQPESDQWTASGLTKETLKKRASFETAKTPELARELAESALLHPSALSIAFLEEAGTVLSEYLPQAAALASLRSALRHHKADVLQGKRWLGKSHYALANQATGLLQTVPAGKLEATAINLQQTTESLPNHWRYQIAFDAQSLGTTFSSLNPHPTITQATHDTATVRIISTNPSADYSTERATLQRTRWLIGGTTGFMLVALAGFVSSIYNQRKLNGMMSNFVASVSHELRAPVASMSLLAERLGAGTVKDAAEQEHYHRLLEGEAKRIASTIENVLAFSRLERGGLRHDPELSDLTALLRDVVAIAQLLGESRKIIIATEFPNAPVERELDPVSLRQAILNLLDNALKFSSTGGQITLALTDNDTGTHIAISDQGPGIPVNERKRIFDAFYRIGSELRRETPGIGIGLAIVKETAEAHGGSVEAQEAAGGGASLIFHLPPTATT